MCFPSLCNWNFLEVFRRKIVSVCVLSISLSLRARWEKQRFWRAFPQHRILHDYLIYSFCRHTRLNKPSGTSVAGMLFLLISPSFRDKQCQGRKQTDRRQSSKILSFLEDANCFLLLPDSATQVTCHGNQFTRQKKSEHPQVLCYCSKGRGWDLTLFGLHWAARHLGKPSVEIYAVFGAS